MNDPSHPSDATELKPAVPSADSAASARFTPGALLAGRYRIVSLLGRGGMGEVYRADDIRLGQQVALKFLPREVAGDAARLDRLYAEIRLGRQVAHPNVCRIYDAAEAEGHHFIAMEYIDGEDLASLLRRIGKLPHDKGIEIAREIAAGLAAAHRIGIVHRDLKPANIMIDGRGAARITDFGLAVPAAELAGRREISGTPCYMAPEQLSGGELTQRADVYALGLVVYEIFTGRRFFEGCSLDEVVAAQKSRSAEAISSETADLDPVVRRVIARCLDREPAKRPSSADAVLAALPGGDPLQAAIEAGETPSPEMIAAAGATGELRPSLAWPLFILALVLIAGSAVLITHSALHTTTDLPLEPEELAFRARGIVAATAAAGKPAGSYYGFGLDHDARAEARENAAGEEVVTKSGRFSPIVFGYRENPVEVPSATFRKIDPFGSDPPLEVEGMARVVLESDGRLRELTLVAPYRTRGTAAGEAEWASLFAAAGLGDARRAAVAPELRPPVGGDRQEAWLVEAGEEMVRVEAASIRGRPVWFRVVTPWARPADPARAPATPFEHAYRYVFGMVLAAGLAVGAVLALRNWRRGRGDRRGAFRLALFTLVYTAAFALRWDHFRDPTIELWVVLALLMGASFIGLVFWVWYLALEPYLRNRWPGTLISWSRLLHGRFSDALVGRHLLIGVIAGVAVVLVVQTAIIVPPLFGAPAPMKPAQSLEALSSWSEAISTLLFVLPASVAHAFLGAIVLLLAHLVFRRRWIAVVVLFAFMALTIELRTTLEAEIAARLACAAIATWTLTRNGLVAFATMFFTGMMFVALPVTVDISAWYFARGLVAPVVLVALAAYGFHRSIGAHSLFAEPVLEE
jgi:hypothetical protein